MEKDGLNNKNVAMGGFVGTWAMGAMWKPSTESVKDPFPA
jgi:hypothetical protein